MGIPSEKNRRSHIRFANNDLELAYIGPDDASPEMNPTLVGLIADESFKGVRLVLVNADWIKNGETYRLRVGKLPTLKARVQWVKNLEGGVRLAGFQYLE